MFLCSIFFFRVSTVQFISLFNVLIHAAKHILREEGDTLDQPRVLNLAPSKIAILYRSSLILNDSGGVAATIIEGNTT